MLIKIFVPTPLSAEAPFFDGAIAAAVAMFGLVEEAMEWGLWKGLQDGAQVL